MNDWNRYWHTLKVHRKYTWKQYLAMLFYRKAKGQDK